MFTFEKTIFINSGGIRFMSPKSVLFSIAVLLVLSFLVGCGNAVTTSVSEAPAATSTEKTGVIEKSDTPVSDTPESEAPASTSTEETVVIEKSDTPVSNTTVSEAPASTPTEETEVNEKSDTDGPRTGDTAPDFTLPDSEGNMVRLSDELKDNRFLVLVFFHSQY